ncbi:MAG: hypothetical protein LQ342_001965 [Letrouitia transgressa]|nr:MAG: hypothetical protein LQ342_001965 [Letrouitia transgressa]
MIVPLVEVLTALGTRWKPISSFAALVLAANQATAMTSYQSSPDAGDAACSFNGVAYPDEGASFPISGGSNATNGSMTTLTSTSTTIINVGTTVAASTSRPTPSGGFGYNGTTITGSVTVPTINPGSTSPPYTGGGCATAVKSFFLGIGLALVVGLML